MPAARHLQGDVSTEAIANNRRLRFTLAFVLTVLRLRRDAAERWHTKGEKTFRRVRQRVVGGSVKELSGPKGYINMQK